MQKATLSRSDYFINSVTGFCGLAVVFFLALHFTIGYEGLLNSAPGKARAPLVISFFYGAVFCAIFQSDQARKRTADSNVPRWSTKLYICLMYFLAFVYPIQLFYYDFKYPSNNEGSFAGLFLGMMACWGNLVVAASANSGHPQIPERAQNRTDSKVDLSRVLKDRTKT